MEKSLKKYFDKVYVINYVEGKERREHIKQMFSDYGLINDIEFIYGMPFGKISAIKPHFEEIAKYGERGISSVNMIGCTFSHYTAIKTAYELGCKSILVFEDDIIIRNDIDLIFEYLDNMPEDWNYLYFNPIFIRNFVNVNDLLLFKNTKDKWVNMKSLSYGYLHDVEGVTNGNYISTGAYAMDRKAMELFINLIENSRVIPNSDRIEYFCHNISQSPLNMYIPKTQLFSTNDMVDTLKFNDEKNTFLAATYAITYSLDNTSDNFLPKYKISNEKSFIWSPSGLIK